MESVLQYITLYAPVVIAIISEIGVFAALITKISSYFKKANDAVNEIKESTEYSELKNQLKLVIKENAELKKALKDVMLKLKHMKVQDETVGNNKKE